MMRKFLMVLVVGATATLGACGSTGESERMTRPTIPMPAPVAAVDRDAVVGTWQCQELNPYPNIPHQTASLTFGQDGKGTSHGTAVLPEQQKSLGLGDMLVESTFDWSASGNQIIVSNQHMTARAADPNNSLTGFVAGMSQFAVNTFASHAAVNTSDVLSQEGGTLEIRPTGMQDPPVLSCTRS